MAAAVLSDGPAMSVIVRFSRLKEPLACSVIIVLVGKVASALVDWRVTFTWVVAWVVEVLVPLSTVI